MRKLIRLLRPRSVDEITTVFDDTARKVFANVPDEKRQRAELGARLTMLETDIKNMAR